MGMQTRQPQTRSFRLVKISMMVVMVTLIWPSLTALANQISEAIQGPSVICRAVLMTDCGCDPEAGTCERSSYQCEWYAFWCWGWCGDHHKVEYPGYCGVPFDAGE